MATTKNVDDGGTAAEEGPVLHYRCTQHNLYFPDEDERRPYTEFNVDPLTLERVGHTRACRRCNAAHRRGITALPPLERVHAAEAKVQRELEQLTLQGFGDSREAASARWRLGYLAEKAKMLISQEGEA